MGNQPKLLMKGVVVVLVLVTLACGLPFMNGGEPTEMEDNSEEQSESSPQDNFDAPQYEEDSYENGMDLAPCPVKEGAMILKFSAVIKIESGVASMTHTLDDGILNLWVDEGPGPAYNVRSLEPAPIPYHITGTMDECVITGEGAMTPDAYGTCEAGVVQLIIIEDWGAADGTAICGDHTESIPFPGIGRMEHTGTDGNGEIFFLDRGFSEAGPGMTSIRPFAMGEGEHIWTIFVDPYFVKP